MGDDPAVSEYLYAGYDIFGHYLCPDSNGRKSKAAAMVGERDIPSCAVSDHFDHFILSGGETLRIGHQTITSHIMLIGGICKAVHYLGENYGVMKGFSYGGILLWPVQTVTILLISIFVYKERFPLHVILGVVLCIAGIGIVSWNGAPMDVFFQSQVSTLLAFVLAGIGACGFTVMQKKLVHEMDSIKLNGSMFTYGLLAVLLVLIPTGPHGRGYINLAGVICVVMLGVITCVGFCCRRKRLRQFHCLWRLSYKAPR
jgi:drug/metabolite transporter (DMT)-like permease